MNAKWAYARVPSSKPLTVAQKALLAEIQASGVRVFDASKWNIRTITALWTAGLIYWNCGTDSDYKQVALIVYVAPVAEEVASVEEVTVAETAKPAPITTASEESALVLNENQQYQLKVMTGTLATGEPRGVKVLRTNTHGGGESYLDMMALHKMGYVTVFQWPGTSNYKFTITEKGREAHAATAAQPAFC